MSIEDLFPPREEHAPHVGDGTTLLRVRDLQLLTRREQVFGPLDWQLDADQLGVVVGQQGSGRSTFLLALGGRMRGVTGEILLHDGPHVIEGVAHPRELLKRTAIARIRGLADIEHSLTVGDCVDERCAIDGINKHLGRQRFHELKTALDTDISREAVVEQLSAPDRALATAMLSCLSPASYALYDDIDASLTEDQLRWMFTRLQVLTELGHTFIVSALDTAVLPDHASVLSLEVVQPAHEHPRTDAPAPPIHRPAHLLDSDQAAVFAAPRADAQTGSSHTGNFQTRNFQTEVPLYREDTK